MLEFIEESFKYFTNFISSIPLKESISALAGSIVGGLFTMRATLKAHKLEKSQKDYEEKEKVKHTLILIKAELNAAWTIYSEEFKDELYELEEGRPLLINMVIGENVFPVYDSAPESLAQLPTELSETIVRIYMRAKGLIKMIELNNSRYELVSAHAREEIKKRVPAISQTLKAQPNLSNQLQKIYVMEQEVMAEYLGMGPLADGIRSLSKEIEEYIELLNIEVEKFISQD
ncbi:hypothetical protein HKW97_25705 (plasmid) [Pseudomonas luteola]|uniref:hypothetical protein n=1 Tax=Pseudomonas luteola TaxID=47886 RepID=UPI00388D4D37